MEITKFQREIFLDEVTEQFIKKWEIEDTNTSKV
jgi:hypothetical protein